MYPNLIYNGDFHLGTESWSGNGITVCEEGGITLTGDLHQYSMFVPVSSSRRYKLSYDIKFNSTSNNNFYIALYPYDSERTLISIASVQKRYFTTLAADLNSGDTTATLTSATNWPTSNNYIGVFTKKAYGEKRATQTIPINTISGNIVTLKSAYSGSTIPAGTKVANNYSGSTYYYPHMISNANLPTTWTTYTAEFNGGDSMRPMCQYFIFHTLGSTHNYSIRNIKLECISDYQECPIDDNKVKANLLKQGIFNAQSYNEMGMKIRYLRDTTNGNSVNSANHWIEVEMINDVGENIALAHTVTISGTSYPDSYATNGIVNSQYLDGKSGVKTLQLDLGYVANVYQIKIWHYYPDGRTYNDNVTEVSVDGENWIQVYKGTHQETADGNTIDLYPYQMSIFEDGKLQCKEIIEW